MTVPPEKKEGRREKGKEGEGGRGEGERRRGRGEGEKGKEGEGGGEGDTILCSIQSLSESIMTAYMHPDSCKQAVAPEGFAQ